LILLSHTVQSAVSVDPCCTLGIAGAEDLTPCARAWPDVLLAVICSCCCKIDRSAGGIDADRKLRPLWTVWYPLRRRVLSSAQQCTKLYLKIGRSHPVMSAC
jgi:hypothetical protein